MSEVLIIEDEYFLQVDLERAITAAGFATESVSSGEEALALFMCGSTITYRALVTDVRLRGMNGWEVARRIREKEPAFPVIYVTAASAEEWVSQGVPNSIFISKPFVDAQLLAALANLVNVEMPRTA